MTYKTFVIDCAPKAKKMATAIEKTANEKAQDGWELVTFYVTNSSKAILVFRVPDETPQEGPVQEETVPQDGPVQEETVPQEGPVQEETVPQEETAKAVGDTE